MTVEEIRTIPLEELIRMGEFECGCGKKHSAGISRLVIESGAVRKLPELLAELGCRRPFLLSGKATFAAAGAQVCAALDGAGIPYAKHVFPRSPVVAAEETVGSAVLHFDYSCDSIIGVGSGVINDTGKILAAMTGKPYIIVGTAPSMDGFASATSSMERDGLKVSLDTAFPTVIVGDLEILAAAPMRMLASGVGDMLAKYVSLTEWQLARLLLDEYYCPVVEALVRRALEQVVKYAPALVTRDKAAVKAVMEGLVIAGIAMKYAGCSRPASGTEHYFSHVWDMRSLAFADAKADLHGIQAGLGTLYTLKLYDYIRALKPDREKALRYVREFDPEAWNGKLRGFIGPGAEAMIAGEAREKKYDAQKHAARLEKILANWDSILAIVDTLPSYESLAELCRTIGAPLSAEEFGVTRAQLQTTCTMTKDIRDKYISTRLLWDLGELENAAATL